MSSLIKHKYSDEKVRNAVFNLISGCESFPCSLHVHLYYNNTIAKFDSPIQDFSCTRELFRFLVVETVPISEIKECYGEDYKESYIPDFVSDFAYDLQDKVDLSKLKLDTDSSQPLYLNFKYAKHEHYIVNDQVIIRAVLYFDLRGEAYDSLLQNIDLRKFIQRQYEHETADVMLRKNLGYSDYDSYIVSHHEDLGTLYHDGGIYMHMLRDYVYFKFLEKIFEVKFNPFFEKDGLIHQKANAFGQKQPVFDLPEQLIDLNLTKKELIIGRKNHFSDHFFL